MGDLRYVMIAMMLIGIGATAVMDLWLMILRRLKVPTLNFAFLGRWVGHIFHGKWFHAGIAKARPVKRELLIGWFAHYVIGVFFAGLLLAVTGIEWVDKPVFTTALFIGVATVVVPLFVMQPALGSGIAFSKTAAPLRNCIRSVANHAVFGCGLYIAGIVLVRLH